MGTVAYYLGPRMDPLVFVYAARHVVNIGKQNGIRFMVMELLDG
jgi:hypothetical protein